MRPRGERDRDGDATGMRPSDSSLPTIEHMAIKKMEHVGIVVDDLPAAIEFFVELGLEPGGTGQVEGEWVDRIIALDGTKAELAMLRTPDGDVEIELVKFHSPPTQGGDPHAPSNTPGLRHLSFLVDDIDPVVAGLQARGTELVGELVPYEDSYRLCYVRGPEGSSSSWQRRSTNGAHNAIGYSSSCPSVSYLTISRPSRLREDSPCILGSTGPI